MKLKKILTALILSLTCLFMALGCNSKGGPANNVTATTYLAIDINPSVELTLDKNEKVLSVKALNDDGKILLFQADVVGDNVTQATEKLANLAVELGFITDFNNGISLSVIGDNEDEIFNKIKVKFEEKSGVKVEANVKITLNKELENLKSKYPDNEAIQNLTLNKFRLIKSAMEKDSTLTIEVAVTVDVQELIEIIKKYDKIIEDLDDEAEDSIERIEKEYERKEKELLDSCYDFIDLSQSTGLKLLRSAYDYFENLEEVELDKYENAILTDEQIRIIAEKLNVASEDINAFIERCKNANGEITLDSVEDEIDRIYRNLSSSEREAFEALYDTVDAYLDELEEAVAIPEELKTQIINKLNEFNAILGVSLPDNITTLEYLEDYIEDIAESLEDQIEAMEKSLKDLIKNDKTLKKAYEDKKAEIKSELENLKTQKKQAIEQEKQLYKDRMEQLISGRKNKN